MPSLIILNTALRRPSWVRKVLDLAVPIRVPPCGAKGEHRNGGNTENNGPGAGTHEHRPNQLGECIFP